jgi:hypothetical protein
VLQVCYLVLLLASVAAFVVLWRERRNLMLQYPGQHEPNVLPNTGSLILGEHSRDGGGGEGGGGGGGGGAGPGWDQ